MSDKAFDLLFGTFLFVALPYFVGFIYLQSYFESFGIEMNELEISSEYIFSSAFFAIKSVFLLAGNETHNLFLLSVFYLL